MVDSRVAARGKAARVAAFEARTAHAATGDLDEKLGSLVDMLNLAAGADPATEKRTRKALARALQRLGPHVARTVRPLLADGVKVFVDGERIAVDPLDDDLIATQLRKVDTKVRAKARVLAFDIVTGRAPLRTEAQRRALAERIMAVGSPAEAVGSTVAVRTAALATISSTDKPLVWVTQPGCCGHCAGMSGSVRQPRAKAFFPRLRIVDKPLPWVSSGVEAPPLHDGCRCALVAESPGLSNALAKASAQDVARGKVGHMSAPAKARAARRVLRSRAPLTPASARAAAGLARSLGA